MSENVGGEPQGRGSFVRGPRDFYGGLVLIGVAIFAYWASYDLPGMRGFAFGPGTAPRGFAMVLGRLGAQRWLITGLTHQGSGHRSLLPPRPVLRHAVRGAVRLAGAAAMGLVIASFLSIMAAAGATPEARLIETLIWGAVLTAFCCFLFPVCAQLADAAVAEQLGSGRDPEGPVVDPMNRVPAAARINSAVTQPCSTSFIISPSASASRCRR